MEEISVAFLDDGVNVNLFSELDKIDLYKVVDDKVIFCPQTCHSKKITHGTLCVKIFLHYTKVKVNIISIEILEQNKRCNVDRLIIALNWIKLKGIKIVNLSLGTSFFLDEVPLKKCINQLTEAGHIIVAAQNNAYFATYPAAFANVIGVSAISENRDIMLNPEHNFTGIDILAKSEHEIELGDKKIISKHSNSYATPYVTAMVTNLYEHGMDILDVKRGLCLAFDMKMPYLKQDDWYNNQELNMISFNDKAEDIDIPLICIYYNEKDLQEVISSVDDARRSFYNSEYNCKVFFDHALGVLHGFEHWVEGYTMKEYIEFYMVDIILILIDMNKGVKYLHEDLNLRYGISEKSKEMNFFPNIKGSNLFQYLMEELQKETSYE